MHRYIIVPIGDIGRADGQRQCHSQTKLPFWGVRRSSHVCMAQMPAGETNPLSARSRSSQTKRTVRIGVGLLPYISIASVWRRRLLFWLHRARSAKHRFVLRKYSFPSKNEGCQSGRGGAWPRWTTYSNMTKGSNTLIASWVFGRLILCLPCSRVLAGAEALGSSSASHRCDCLFLINGPFCVFSYRCPENPSLSACVLAAG